MLNPRTSPCRVEFEAGFGSRIVAADYGLRTDSGLPPDWALDRIAGSRILLGPGRFVSGQPH
eukprot:15434757-Alexandrium_andersonii.AAC.1